MKNIKFVASFSAFGFVLSFIFGLFSHAGFGHIILFAFIFAIVFAGLGFGLQFVFDKVLDIDSGENASVQVSDAQGKNSSSGQKVDIVIGDQEIPEDSEDSQFFVGTNHQMLNESDYSDGEVKKESEATQAVKTAQNFAESKMFSGKSETEAPSNDTKTESDSIKAKIVSENSSSQAFVPISLGETPGNISGTEAKSVNNVDSSSQNPVKTDSSSAVSIDSNPDELDVLPDLEDIAFKENKASSEVTNFEDGEIIHSQSVSSAGSVDASAITEGQDAAVMAKAISTLLAKDN